MMVWFGGSHRRCLLFLVFMRFLFFVFLFFLFFVIIPKAGLSVIVITTTKNIKRGAGSP